MNEPIESFKKRLNEAMAERNMKPVELANRCNISKSTISHYMSGYTEPKSKRLYTIAKVLDVDETWLMGLDVPMEKVGKPIHFNTTEEEFFNILKPLSGDKDLGLTVDNLKRIASVISQNVNSSKPSLIKKFTNLTDNQLILLSYFEDLNIFGQKEAINRIVELTYLPKYSTRTNTKTSTKEQITKNINDLTLNAAHERTDIEVTDEMKKHDDDIMNDDSEWE